MAHGGEPGHARGLAYRIGQDIGIERERRRDNTLRVGRIQAVKTEDRVEVDQAATLKLGHLRKRDPNADAVCLGELVHAPADGDDGAAPQFGRVRVPHHGGVVVVAVRAQRLAEAGVVCLVPLPAGDPPPVRAEVGLAPGAAPGHLPAAGDHAGVNRAEGGRGEGREHARVRGDRRGHALAPGQPGADQLVGVGPVSRGTGRADRSPAVTARQVDHLVRGVLRVERGEDLPGTGIDVADGAAQPDRANASPGRLGPRQPLVIVVTGSTLEQLGVEGPRLPCRRSAREPRPAPGRSSRRTPPSAWHRFGVDGHGRLSLRSRDGLDRSGELPHEVAYCRWALQARTVARCVFRQRFPLSGMELAA